MKTHISILIALITLVSLGLMPASASAQLQASKCPAGLICVPATKTSPAYVPRTTPIACYSISGNLAVGSRGADVAALQAFLIEKRFDIPSISQGAVAKGHFGPSTQAALAKYQKSQNLQPTGTLNTASRTKINADSCSSAAVPVSRTIPLQLPISNNSNKANEFPRIAVPPQASVPTVEAPPKIKQRVAIANVSGPTAIEQRNQYSWTISSNAISAGVPSESLLYSADWGTDEDITNQYTPSFTHQYANAGVYTVRFSVTDTRVGGLGEDTKIVFLKVNVPNAGAPISVTSPVGGESYKPGDTIRISWKGAMKVISLTQVESRSTRVITQLPQASSGDTSGSYSYVIPSDALSGWQSASFSIRVYSDFGGSGDDIFDSSQTFTIRARDTACAVGETWIGSECVSMSISSFSQNSAAPGAAIRISGKGFQQGDTACFATNGAIKICVTPDSISPTQLSLAVPNLAAGTYGVRARFGDSMQSNELFFTITPARVGLGSPAAETASENRNMTATIWDAVRMYFVQ